jgi:hypothetical protein
LNKDIKVSGRESEQKKPFFSSLLFVLVHFFRQRENVSRAGKLKFYDCEALQKFNIDFYCFCRFCPGDLDEFELRVTACDFDGAKVKFREEMTSLLLDIVTR